MHDAPETPVNHRTLPSVSSLLAHPAVQELLPEVQRETLTTAVRAAVAAVRNGSRPRPGGDDWTEAVAFELENLLRPSLRPLLNATGIVLHTNLGRAPLADAAITAIHAVAAGYSTLEYDLDSGDRGSRDVHCLPLLRQLTGAEDALVINNCAAAMVLALNTAAAGREVVISRGELIEIGGSFRIPDIMARSSARLVEVGTTNRTHLLDYRAAITPQTAAIVKVHRSNFVQSGYTADVSLQELAPLAGESGLPLIFDQGSGLLISLANHGLAGELTARDALDAGADLVLMSGDKLLGGPQAGIAVGRADIVDRMRSNPLARAFRADKTALAALEATLRLYRDPANAVLQIPALAMLCTPVERIESRARSLACVLTEHGHNAEVVSSRAAVGAGAFPTLELPSAAVALAGDPAVIPERLRRGPTPVVARIHDGRVLLDLRSVPEREDAVLAAAVISALSG
ncbi:MAG TPA: L-seryl-tRNA(Sec) selenium transferase [Gemmatimonadaceae bacterium]|nr:L-seryl-tRNA(Sec) selenium transferase [Gemmatimonadaceae bacterium]